MKVNRSVKGSRKRSCAALALALSLMVLCSGSAMAAGAHKWTPASEEYGPGIVLRQGPEYPEEDVVVTQEGQVIDSFNDVAAYCRPGGREDQDQVYNCVVLVERYYRTVYGIEVYNLFQYEIPFTDMGGEFKATESPVPGDIGYMTSDDGGPHWFILKRVNGDGTYTAFEQNWKWVENGVTYATINRRVPGTARDLRFFRRPGA